MMMETVSTRLKAGRNLLYELPERERVINNNYISMLQPVASPADLAPDGFFYDAFNRRVYYLKEGRLRVYHQSSNQ